MPGLMIPRNYGDRQENMLILDSVPETGEDRMIIFGVKPQLEYVA